MRTAGCRGCKSKEGSNQRRYSARPKCCVAVIRWAAPNGHPEPRRLDGPSLPKSFSGTAEDNVPFEREAQSRVRSRDQTNTRLLFQPDEGTVTVEVETETWRAAGLKSRRYKLFFVTYRRRASRGCPFSQIPERSIEKA